jgi:hypothetical protein
MHLYHLQYYLPRVTIWRTVPPPPSLIRQRERVPPTREYPTLITQSHRAYSVRVWNDITPGSWSAVSSRRAAYGRTVAYQTGITSEATKDLAQAHSVLGAPSYRLLLRGTCSSCCTERSHYYRCHFSDSLIPSIFLSLAGTPTDRPAARSLRLGLWSVRMRRTLLVCYMGGSGGGFGAPGARAARVRVAASFLSFSFSLGFFGALAHHGLQAHEKEESVSSLWKRSAFPNRTARARGPRSSCHSPRSIAVYS